MKKESLKGQLDLLLLAVVGAGAARLTLILAALLASAVPAWRAAEIDPLQALREE